MKKEREVKKGRVCTAKVHCENSITPPSAHPRTPIPGGTRRAPRAALAPCPAPGCHSTGTGNIPTWHEDTAGYIWQA